MKYKILYGTEPKFSDRDLQDFSRGSYECRRLFRNRDGHLVIISKCRSGCREFDCPSTHGKEVGT